MTDDAPAPSRSRPRPISIAPRALPTMGVEEIWRAAPRIEPVIGPIQACVGRPTLIYGPPAAGKSIGLGAIIMAAVTGRPILGDVAREPIRALWLDAEVGARLTASRVQRLARGMGVGPSDIGDRLRIAVHPALALDDPAAERTLVATCGGYRVAVLDSLTALSGAIDETTPAIGRALLTLARVSDRTECAVIVLHHARRDGEIRGSTSITAACESVWGLSTSRDRIVMSHERSPIGAPMPDVTMRIRDVAIDGDPLAGLAVDLVGMSDATAGAASESVDHEILAYLASHGPYLGGAQSLAEAMGHGATHRDAIRRLIADGTIRRTGASQTTTLSLGGRR